MNPFKYAQMMKYLTRVKKQKPDLPDVFPASQAPIPAKKKTVEDMEAVNRFVRANPRQDMAGGGMLVQPSADGSRPGYKKDNPGSLYKQKNGYVVQFGDAKSPNKIFKYFGPREYGSVTKAKKAAEDFKIETGKTWTPGITKPNIKTSAAEEAIQKLLDEGTEITTKNILDKMPEKIVKEGVADSVLNKAKKKFPNLDFKKSPRIFIKTPKEIARVSKLIEDGLPLKEIQAKGFDVKFIKRVAKVNNLKIAETSYDYYENVKKITSDLTKIGKNKKIVEAFENGTVSKDLIDKVGKVTKSNDPFYDSRLLFKLAEYYDGSLEEWYKPKLSAATKNQIANANKVIQTSATFLGGKRNGYAYQKFLYDWGAKKIDKVLDLPLGTFRAIQRDIAKTLPSGVSLDEVFGVKSSGRFAPIEGILTNPLESGANVDKGSFVDNLKSFYQKQLVNAKGDPKKQKEILKEYNDSVQKSKVRYPDVEFPNYKVGQPPNKTIKGFDKLPPLIQSKLLESYETTGVSPVTKKAVSIFDVAKATGSKTFEKLDESVQASLSNITSKQQTDILKKMGFKCKYAKADGGRIGLSTGSGRCDDPASYTDDINKTRQDLKSSDVRVRAAAQAKLNKGLQVAKTLPTIGKFLRRAGQATVGAVSSTLKTLGLTTPVGYAIEGIVEGGVYDYFKKQGYTDKQALAETFTPGLISGRPEGVPWYGGAETLLEKELIGDPQQNPKVAQYVSALKDQDQVYDAFGRLQQGEQASRKDIIDAARADIRDLNKTGTISNINRIMNPESIASRAYQTAVEKQAGRQDQRARDYMAENYVQTDPTDFAEQQLQKKRNEAMLKMFPTPTVEDVQNVYKAAGRGDDLKYFEAQDYKDFMKDMDDFQKQSYFAENFRLEKAGGGIAKIAGVSSGPPPESGPMSQGLQGLMKRVKNR